MSLRRRIPPVWGRGVAAAPNSSSAEGGAFCAVFNGSSSFLSLTDDAAFDGLASFSMMFRGRVPTVDAPLMSRLNGTPAGLLWSVNHTNATNVFVGDFTGTPSNWYTDSIPDFLDPDVDRTIVWTFEDLTTDTAVRCWVDGVETSVARLAGTGRVVLANGGDFLIGASGGVWLASSCVDAVAMWDVTLSEAEALALPASIPSSGLIFHLPLEGDANDASGNGRDFTNTDVTFV